MLRRLGWIALALLIGVMPAVAQEAPSPLEWIPADFAGFVRFSMNDADATLNGLNMALRGAFVLQPTRFDANTQPFTYETVLPMEMLFDIEDPVFASDIFPWLSGDVVVAYRQFDGPLSADQNDMLMILPTGDSFLAASRLNRVIEGQQLGERDTYQGVTLYIGDKSTIAVTPEAVLVGATELVEAALDLHAGEGERLIEQAVYQAIQAEVPDDALAFAYVSGDNTGGIVSLLLSGQSAPDPLLEVAGEALRGVRGQDALESLLLTGDVSGLGFVLKPAHLRPAMIVVDVILYTEASAEAAPADFDMSLLDLVPRSAMMVHRGTDVKAAVNDLLVALPLSNFGGRMLGGFPVDETIASRSGIIADPSAADVEEAVSSLLISLQTGADFDLQADLVDHLSGSYVLAILPSPNRPVPFLNTSFDVVFLAQADDGEAAMAGATKLVETVLGAQELPTESLDEGTFTAVRLQGSGDAVLRLGVVDNTLVIVTGDALEQALAARRGDNRLTNEARWQIFTQDDAPLPEWYVDLNAVYNTFFPAVGGLPMPGQNLHLAMAANTRYLGDGLFSVDLRMTLP